MSDGVTCLKEGWADLKDETQDGEGAWEGHWFSLNSGGELKIFPDAESTEEQVTMVIDLKEIERVERSKGVDFYDFCIDLCYRKECSDKTTRMRPIDRGDMQAWLGVLQTQLSTFTTRTNNGSVITTLHQGWLEKKGEKGAGVAGLGEGYKKRFFVLTARQDQQGEDVEVQHFLHYFKNEDQASDVSEGGIDLGDVDEIRKGDRQGDRNRHRVAHVAAACRLRERAGAVDEAAHGCVRGRRRRESSHWGSWRTIPASC